MRVDIGLVVAAVASLVACSQQEPAAPQRPPEQAEQLVTKFLEGDREAEAELRHIGRGALLFLARARARGERAPDDPPQVSYDALFEGTAAEKARVREQIRRCLLADRLANLIFDIKKAGARTREAQEVYAWLETPQYGAACVIGRQTVLEYLEEAPLHPWAWRDGTVKYVLDPALPPEVGQRIVDTEYVDHLMSLERICALCGLDYEYRDRVIFVSTPERLWVR